MFTKLQRSAQGKAQPTNRAMAPQAPMTVVVRKTQNSAQINGVAQKASAAAITAGKTVATAALVLTMTCLPVRAVGGVCEGARAPKFEERVEARLDCIQGDVAYTQDEVAYIRGRVDQLPGPIEAKFQTYGPVLLAPLVTFGLMMLGKERDQAPQEQQKKKHKKP